MDVIHQDDWTVVVNKPSGWLVHNSAYAGPKEHTVVDEVRAQWAPEAVPIHRLDRGASGALLLASSRQHAAEWAAALAEEATRKIYRALVRGTLLQEHEVHHALSDEDGVKREACTLVRPVATSTVERCSWVEAELKTGRTHQVRRHLDHITHPLLGDTTYGKGPLNRHYRAQHGLHRLALHALELHITHPFTGALCRFVAPVPADLVGPLESLGLWPPPQPAGVP